MNVPAIDLGTTRVGDDLTRGLAAGITEVFPDAEGEGYPVGARGLGALSISMVALRRILPRGSDEATALIAGLESIGACEDVLIAAVPSVQQERDCRDRLVQALMPDSIPQPVELLQARRSAAMRRDMLARYGYLTAEALADLHGSSAKNRYALAARWMREGKVFGVPQGARTVFPAFQFDAHGRPHPIIAPVLDALPTEAMSRWAVALWWYANNAHLPGQARPTDLIGTQDEQHIAAAARGLSEPEPL
jgi:hypothetical protein